MAIVLYEDQERRVRSSVEDLWLSLEEYRPKAMELADRLLAYCIEQAARILDWAFGPSLVSERAIRRSLCLSAILLNLSLVGRAPLPLIIIVVLLWVIQLCQATSSEDLGYRRGFILLVLMAFTVVIQSSFISYVVSEDIPYSESLKLAAAHGTVLVLAVCTDTLWILAIRALFASSTRRRARLCVLALCVLCSTVFPVWPQSATADLDNASYSFMSISASEFMVTRLFVGGISIIILCVATIAFLHRLFWPVASRIVYPLQRFDVLGKRKAMGVLGVALISDALTGSLSTVATFITHWLDAFKAAFG